MEQLVDSMLERYGNRESELLAVKYLREEKCIQCGVCFDVCTFDSVIVE